MSCPICNGIEVSLGTIPFDRNNAEVPIVNDTPTEYHKCTACHFIYCPEMLQWSPEELGAKVYNEDYIKYDPDYISIRPTNWGDMFKTSFSPLAVKNFKHLDYGSGAGVMSGILRDSGWNSIAYDPYSSPVRPAGKFNFITAIEVVEHSANIIATIEDMKSFLTNDGVIMFSTLLADKDTKLDWWYIGARNGHIGILSDASLKIIGKRTGMFFSSMRPNLHLLQSNRSNYAALERGRK